MFFTKGRSSLTYLETEEYTVEDKVLLGHQTSWRCPSKTSILGKANFLCQQSSWGDCLSGEQDVLLSCSYITGFSEADIMQQWTCMCAHTTPMYVNTYVQNTHSRLTHVCPGNTDLTVCWDLSQNRHLFQTQPLLQLKITVNHTLKLCFTSTFKGKKWGIQIISRRKASLWVKYHLSLLKNKQTKRSRSLLRHYKI
jgi:hypothetical protein